MIDLFLFLVPLCTLAVILNLLALKLALKDNVTMVRIAHKKIQTYPIDTQHQEQPSIKNILKFLLLRFTPLELCLVRRGNFKLPLLLSISLVCAATYFVPIQPFFLYALTGSMIYIVYFLVGTGLSSGGQEKWAYKHRQKYLQIISSILTIVLNLVLMGSIYKNYLNSELLVFMGNAGLCIVFDNFLVRPVAVLVVGIPLSKSTLVQNHIQECQKEALLLEMYQQVGEKEILLKPKKMFSPSKIPRTIPLDLEIEPRPVEYPRRDDDLERPIDMLKRIKKQKLLPPLTINLQKYENISMNSLLNSTKKEEHIDQIDFGHQTERVEEVQVEKIESEKVETEETGFPTKKKIVSQNMIMINPSHNQPVQNEEDLEIHPIEETKPKQQEDEEEAQYYQQNFEDDDLTKKAATFNVSGDSRGADPLKISLNSSGQPTSRQEPLNIDFGDNFNIKLSEQNSEEEQQEFDNIQKRDFMTIDDKNIMGVLQIKQENIGDQIEEIDFNSPQRRRKMEVHVEQEYGMKPKKNPKKKKVVQPNRLIKYSTGKPYLEDQSAPLTKGRENQRSQSLSRKSNLVGTRFVNSVKRPNKRIHAQNNQNVSPLDVYDI